MIFGQKIGQILIIPSFWLKFDDIAVTLSLIVLSKFFCQIWTYCHKNMCPKQVSFPYRSKLKIIKVWSAAVFLEYYYHFLQHTPAWTCNQTFLTWIVISYLSWSSSYGFHQYTVSNIQREFLALNPLKMWRLSNEIIRRIQVKKVIICKYK